MVSSIHAQRIVQVERTHPYHWRAFRAINWHVVSSLNHTHNSARTIVTIIRQKSLITLENKTKFIFR